MSDHQKNKDQNALDYHQFPTPGKLQISATKPLTTQNDLSLAYSPGVASACTAIHANPGKAADYTIRSNLVGVVTNGSAVLGQKEKFKVISFKFKVFSGSKINFCFSRFLRFNVFRLITYNLQLTTYNFKLLFRLKVRPSVH